MKDDPEECHVRSLARRVRARPFTRPNGGASSPDGPRYPDAADPTTPCTNYGDGGGNVDESEAGFATGYVVTCRVKSKSIKIFFIIILSHETTLTKGYFIVEYIQLLAVW